MSEKLGQSLDEILASQRMNGARGGRNNSRRGRGGRAATSAPVGGIAKSRKPVKSVTKNVTKAAPSGPSGGNQVTRIMVSNLPKDITEQQVKDFFRESRLNTKSVSITYGANQVSRGEAIIAFHRLADALQAKDKLHGILVDNQKLNVIFLVDANSAAALPFTQEKKLAERITVPKPHPKSATITKTANTNGGAQGAKRGAKRGAGRTRGTRGGRDARPAKKTAEELDLEMADYWETGNGVTAENGDSQTAEQTVEQTAQPAANGDATMDDEIL